MLTVAIVAAAWLGLAFPLGILIGRWLKGIGASYPEPSADSWNPG